MFVNVNFLFSWTVCTLIVCFTADPSIVETEFGAIKGLLLSNEKVRVFRSIPYASPPIDDLRFAPPQNPEKWSNTLDCTKEVVGCPQRCHDLPLTTTECAAVQSEDCLYLNVWTPIDATPQSSLPVLLWIHGGAFLNGYSGGLVYNGTNMVNATNVVVVTTNYRLGALGSLFDSELGLTGNYGYMDQVFAIEFVYRNIATFGGDPDKITLFGESAGGHSVALHLLNKSSVVKGVIMESGPLGQALRTEQSWGTLPLTFSSQLGCDPNTLSSALRLQCLRSKNSSQIVEVQYTANSADPQQHFAAIKDGMPWTPTVGNNSMIVDQPLVAMRNGDYNTNLAFLGGTNEGEWFLFTPPFVTYKELESKLDNELGKENTPKIMAFYNVSRNGDVHVAQANIFTDCMMRCPTRNSMQSTTKYAQNSKSVGYMYHYNYIASFVRHIWYFQPECWTHVCHEEELPVVWDPNAASIYVYPTPEEVLMSKQIQYFWTNFAETSNPNNGKNANNLHFKWLSYESNTKQQTLMMNNASITNGMVMENGPDAAVCDFWDDIGWNWFDGVNW